MPGSLSLHSDLLQTHMARVGLTDQDLTYLTEVEGLSLADIETQLELLTREALYVTLDRPCRPGDGLRVLDDVERDRLAQRFRDWRATGEAHRFIPASGAASRLFAALEACLHFKPAPTWERLKQLSGENSLATDCVQILNQLADLPFEGLLRETLGMGHGDWEKALQDYGPVKIIQAILQLPGLGFAHLPKALIPFHRQGQSLRTALDEQISETEHLVRDSQGHCRVHFTVSPEHRTLFESACDANAKRLQASGSRLHVTYSEQSPKTRTLALWDDKIFRENERPVLRPGGHGSLLTNLGSVEGALVFVKNIDNVARTEALAAAEVWHAALAGLLLELQNQAHGLSRQLDGSHPANAAQETLQWLHENIGWKIPTAIQQGSDTEKIAYAKQALYRPIRVGGMVINQGEPGGGPFWVRGRHGEVTSQIVEASQVNLKDPEQKSLLSQATHFNPVDFVCGLRDYKGKPYSLADFSDSEAWFLARKPKAGSFVTALERPGLWNGAMAGWFTVFVEIPVALFNPVKTITDLLRPAHQGQS